MAARNSNLVWIDLEMTGLNPEQDRILEIATVVTDKHAQIIAEGPVFAIYQDKSLLASMDNWNTKHHTESGLVDRVQKSVVTEDAAEAATLEFLQQYVAVGKSPLCGNSIYQDRRFLRRYMKKLESFFHYRLLDVSTIKELAKRWRPDIYKGCKKKSKHQALDDIKDSIFELQYYREKFFNLDD